jgi:hypothetical protein
MLRLAKERQILCVKNPSIWLDRGKTKGSINLVDVSIPTYVHVKNKKVAVKENGA